MKKLLLITTLLMAANSYAYLNWSHSMTCTFDATLTEFEKALRCTISTTTSLPSLIVEGVEVDLNSPEAQERLQAELNEDVEPVLLDQLAIQKNITTDELKVLLQK